VPAIAVFWDEISAGQWHAAENAALKLGLRLAGIEFREQPYDYERAFAQLPPEHRHVLMVLTSPVFAVPNRARLPEFALRRRMASIYSLRQYVDLGGLMSYGASFTALYRRAAEIVDRVAGGAGGPGRRRSPLNPLPLARADRAAEPSASSLGETPRARPGGDGTRLISLKGDDLAASSVACG
jgi:hypothetical protein